MDTSNDLKMILVLQLLLFLARLLLLHSVWSQHIHVPIKLDHTLFSEFAVSLLFRSLMFCLRFTVTSPIYQSTTKHSFTACGRLICVFLVAWNVLHFAVECYAFCVVSTKSFVFLRFSHSLCSFFSSTCSLIRLCTAKFYFTQEKCMMGVGDYVNLYIFQNRVDNISL